MCSMQMAFCLPGRVRVRLDSVQGNQRDNAVALTSVEFPTGKANITIDVC